MIQTVILASGSPRRDILLRQINLDFEVIPSNISETIDYENSPSNIVMDLAIRKTEGVIGQHKPVNSLIIGADTIVVLDDQILEKPMDAGEAQQMLNELCGRTHQVYTGIALVKTDKRCNIRAKTTFFERTDVTFGYLDEIEISNYIATENPLDKAGSYGIQDDQAALFIKKINGDYYNVVGFPLYRFYQALKEFAPELIPLLRIT